MPRLIAPALLAACLMGAAACEADAQYVHVAYSPVVAYPPVVHTAYYAPAPPAPYVTYYAPAPAPMAVAPVAPVAVVQTRWRPFLGGTVTRVRYGYAPVYVGY